MGGRAPGGAGTLKRAPPPALSASGLHPVVSAALGSSCPSLKWEQVEWPCVSSSPEISLEQAWRGALGPGFPGDATSKVV